MTSQPASFHPPEPLPEQLPDVTDDDFADEHNSTSVADDLEGGPEGATEPETPRGHGGLE